MVQGRDSKGCFIEGNVPWNKRASMPKVVYPGRDSKGRFIKGNAPWNKRADILKVVCPACQQKVKAIARNSHVKGFCAVAMQYVDIRV